VQRLGPSRGLAPAALAALLALPLAAHAQTAGEDLKEACASSYEQAQTLRRAAKLTLARAQLLVCERTCPGSLSRDCRRWGVEISSEIPSIIVHAIDRSGRPVSNVELSVDGELVELPPDGAALPLDPGRHRLVLRSGDQRRTASITLEPRAQQRLTVEFDSGPAELLPVHGDPEIERERSVATPPAVWALAAVGVVGLGTGAVLGIKGHVDRSNLKSRCAPDCDPDEVEAIRRDWTIAGVAAGVGALATGLAIWWVVNGSAKTRVGLQATPKGPRAVVGGSF
jgi:hypothetical protein